MIPIGMPPGKIKKDHNYLRYNAECRIFHDFQFMNLSHFYKRYIMGEIDFKILLSKAALQFGRIQLRLGSQLTPNNPFLQL